MAPLVRTGGSRHTGLAAPPHRNIHFRRWVKVAQSCDLCYTCVMGIWESKNRHKYLLQYHIISYASIERNCRCQNLPVV